MTTTDRTRLPERPTAHISPVYVHADDAGLLAVELSDDGSYVTLGISRAVALFFDSPLALAVRLRDLADELEAADEYTQVQRGDAA